MMHVDAVRLCGGGGFVLALSVFRFGVFFVAGTPVAEKTAGPVSQQPAQEKTPWR